MWMAMNSLRRSATFVEKEALRKIKPLPSIKYRKEENYHREGLGREK
jgi:hypothetical protein